MRHMEIILVFTSESGTPVLLGTYLHTREDTVFYTGTDGEIRCAPEDCVVLRKVQV